VSADRLHAKGFTPEYLFFKPNSGAVPSNFHQQQMDPQKYWDELRQRNIGF
jgi:hypothetical protein